MVGVRRVHGRHLVGVRRVPLIAIQVLHVGPAAVSALAAVGLAVGALLALPLGPRVDARRKKPVMIATDLMRFGALLTIPAAYVADLLTYTQLLVVSVIGAAANIAFTAAGGAYLKQLVRPDHLLVANGRFESTTWTATAIGPTLGGAAISLLGPAVTVTANAVGFLLSAVGIGAIRQRRLGPSGARAGGSRAGGSRPRPSGARARSSGRRTWSRAGRSSMTTGDCARCSGTPWPSTR